MKVATNQKRISQQKPWELRNVSSYETHMAGGYVRHRNAQHKHSFCISRRQTSVAETNVYIGDRKKTLRKVDGMTQLS